MKLIVASLLFAFAVADRLDNTYLPPSSAKTAGGSNFLTAPQQSYGAPIRRPQPSYQAPQQNYGAPQQSYGAPSTGGYTGPTSPPVAILRYNNENKGDGTYQFDFETENRIQQQERGELKNAGTDQASSVVQGSYSYVGDDGQTYTINYIADEQGYRAEGAHLPVAPPIPEEILKALEQNAADEAKGIIDDGQYRAGPSERQGGAPDRQYLAPRPQGPQGYRY